MDGPYRYFMFFQFLTGCGVVHVLIHGRIGTYRLFHTILGSTVVLDLYIQVTFNIYIN